MEALLAADDELEGEDIGDGLLFTPGDFADFCEYVAPLLLEPFSQLAPLIDRDVKLHTPQLSLIAPEAIENQKSPHLLFVPLVQLAGEGAGTTCLFELPGQLAGRLAILMIGGDEEGAEDVEEAHLSSLRELFHQYRLLLSKGDETVISAPASSARSKSVRPVISGKRGAGRLLNKLFASQDHLLGLTAICTLGGEDSGELRFVFPVELSKELLERYRKRLVTPVEKQRTVVEEKPKVAKKEIKKTEERQETAKEKKEVRPKAASGIELTARLGKIVLQEKDIAALAPGTVLRLDNAAGEEVDLVVDGRLFARGEVTVDGDHYAVRIRVINEAVRQ